MGGVSATTKIVVCKMLTLTEAKRPTAREALDLVHEASMERAVKLEKARTASLSEDEKMKEAFQPCAQQQDNNISAEEFTGVLANLGMEGAEIQQALPLVFNSSVGSRIKWDAFVDWLYADNESGDQSVSPTLAEK